jgi:chromosome segregation ATPase
VYYQTSFDKLTTRQEDTSADLGQCHADLEQYKFNLNKTMRTLNMTTQDIRRYDELYTTKSEELETTQETLDVTETELKSTQVSLQEETALKAKYKQDYEDQLEISRDLEEQNAILTAQKKQLESEIIGYKQDIDSSQVCIDNFLSDYDADLTAAMKDDVTDCKP